MEKKVDLEIWWSSLAINEKERIARKGMSKVGEVDENMVTYPACTRWWQALDEKTKSVIYAHCVAVHGDELREWKEGNPYGD